MSNKKRRVGGTATFRRLAWPDYVPQDLNTPTFRWKTPFRWKSDKPIAPFSGLSRTLASAIKRKLNGGPLGAFALATAEWVLLALWSDLAPPKRKQAWKVVEWLWLRYFGGLHPALVCDSPALSLSQWRGTRCEIAAGHALKAALVHGGRERVLAISAIAALVLGEVEEYQAWQKRILKRLLLYPEERLATSHDPGPCHYYTKGGTVECLKRGQVNEDFPPLRPGEYLVSFKVPRQALDPTIECTPAELPAMCSRLRRRLQKS